MIVRTACVGFAEKNMSPFLSFLLAATLVNLSDARLQHQSWTAPNARKYKKAETSSPDKPGLSRQKTRKVTQFMAVASYYVWEEDAGEPVRVCASA
ncbi:hypothetical protein VTH06DRAFT_142 [Thermothelomyces fergusii]